MTNIHSYTKRFAEKKVDSFDHVPHIAFSKSDIESAEGFQVFHENDTYKITYIGHDMVTGVRINKDGSVTKNRHPKAFFFHEVDILYIAPEAPEEPVELYEFEGEEYPIRTEEGVKEFENVCRNLGGSGGVHQVGIKYHHHCEKCNFGYGTESNKIGWQCPECDSQMIYMGYKAIFDGTGDFVPL